MSKTDAIILNRINDKRMYNCRITLWAWIEAGWFPLSFSFLILGFFHYIIVRLDSYKI